MSLYPANGTALRRDLTGMMQQYFPRLAEQGFIGTQVAPIAKTLVDSAQYAIFTRDNFLKRDDALRRPGATYNQIDGHFDHGSFACIEHGLEAVIDDVERKKYANFFDYEKAQAAMLMFRLMREHEARVAALAQDTSVHTAHNASVSWATAATADPLSDIEAGLNAIEQKTGIPRSEVSLICPRPDFKNLTRCDQIIEQVKYTFSGNGGVRPAVLKPLHIASILEVKQVLVPNTAYDTAPEGQSESLSTIWSPGLVTLAVLGRSGVSLTDPNNPAAFRTMLWTADSPQFPVYETYRSEERRSDIIRARMNTDEVLTSEADLLVYLIDTTP